MVFKRTLIAASVALLALPALAQEAPRPGYGPNVTTAAAKKIAAAVIAECAANKWNIAVAVVDTAGGLVYYERMEDTQSASFDIAIMKAKAAATYRRTTRVFMEGINKTPATATLPGVVGSPGGVPIFSAGKVIGAVGVSGVTGDQDEQCAKAGLTGM